MRYLSVNEILEIYRCIMEQSGGAVGIRDMGALESAVAQPHMSFGGTDLYPTIVEKTSALGFSLIKITPSLMVTNALVMQQWKLFLC